MNMPVNNKDEAGPTGQSRRSFLKTGAGVLGGLTLALGPDALSAPVAEKVSSSRRPHLFVFLGEGLRYDELSCAGHPLVKTPNMDRVAREGMTFGNAFVTNALCLPSRASMLTGMYSHTTGVLSNEPSTATRGGNGPIPHDIPLF